jgi:hypothetical protein
MAEIHAIFLALKHRYMVRDLASAAAAEKPRRKDVCLSSVFCNLKYPKSTTLSACSASAKWLQNKRWRYMFCSSALLLIFRLLSGRETLIYSAASVCLSISIEMDYGSLPCCLKPLTYHRMFCFSLSACQQYRHGIHL